MVLEAGPDSRGPGRDAVTIDVDAARAEGLPRRPRMSRQILFAASSDMGVCPTDLRSTLVFIVVFCLLRSSGHSLLGILFWFFALTFVFRACLLASILQLQQQQMQPPQGARALGTGDALAASAASAGLYPDWPWRTDRTGAHSVDPMALQFALLTRELDERDYAALAALDDLPGSAGAGSRRGLSQDAIDSLPVHVVRKPAAAGDAAAGAAAAGAPVVGSAAFSRAGQTREDDSGEAGGGCCSVCLENFAAGAVLRSLPCMHKFHRDCIDPWLATCPTCPVCKFDLQPDD